MMSAGALIAGLAIAPAALALDTANVAQSLAGSSALELPAKAADLVTKATAADKQAVAIAAVKAAIAQNPEYAVAIASAVARATPSVAPVVAVAASTLQHKKIELITKAVVMAAPAQAAKVVAALIKEFPRDYAVVAVAANEAAPNSGRDILAVVSDSVPAVQSSLRSALANLPQDSVVSVQAVLSQMGYQPVGYNVASSTGASTANAQASGSAFRSQTTSTPFTALVGAAQTDKQNQTGTEGQGTRTYSSP